MATDASRSISARAMRARMICAPMMHARMIRIRMIRIRMIRARTNHVGNNHAGGIHAGNAHIGDIRAKEIPSRNSLVLVGGSLADGGPNPREARAQSPQSAVTGSHNWRPLLAAITGGDHSRPSRAIHARGLTDARPYGRTGLPHRS
jgi:hypothetical protein